MMSNHTRPIYSLLLNTCSSWILLFLRNVSPTLGSWLCWARAVNVHPIRLLVLQMCALSMNPRLHCTLFLSTDSRWLLFCSVVFRLLLVFCLSYLKKLLNLVTVDCSGVCTVCLCNVGSVCTFWWGSNARSSLTLYFPLPSKGGSQRLTSRAKHPVSPAMAVPHAVPSEAEVLDPVSWQGKLRRVITVTGVGVPVEFTEGTLHHTKETVQVAHYKLWCIHWWVPQDTRDNVIGCAHPRLLVHLWGKITEEQHNNRGESESRSLRMMLSLSDD